MVKQYPHILYKKVSIQGTRDTNGDWIAGSDTWEKVGYCREEPNYKSQLVHNENGSKYVFEWVIYLPKKTKTLKEGDEVKVLDNQENKLLQKSVKRFSRGQLNCRIWL